MGNKSHFFRQPGGGGDAFIATFRTTTDNESITLPYLSNGTYSGTIDWGDGTIVENSYANRTHNYKVAGDYDVTVLGDCVGWDPGNGNGNYIELINIKQWGNGFKLINGNGSYLAMPNGDITATDILNLEGITNASYMFAYDSNLVFNESINNWDVSNITNLNHTFRNCNSFNQPLGNWDVSSVTNMVGLFRENKLFNRPLNSWNVWSVENLSLCFRQSVYNQSLDNWDVANVKTMQACFAYAYNFNQDVSSWDYSGLNTTNSLLQFMQSKSSSNYNSAYYDNLLIKWASDPSEGGLQPNIIGELDMGSIKYTANGAAARASILANNKAQTINDGGQI